MSKSLFRVIILCAVLGVFALPQSAMAIVVPDGDFEQATTVDDNYWAYVTDLYAAGETPWIVSFLTDGGTPWLGNNYPAGGAYPGVGHSGLQWIEGNYAIINQLLTDTYVEGTTYTLSAWIWHSDTDELLEFYFGTDTTDGYNGGTTTLAASYYPDHTLKTWKQYGGKYKATAADAGKQIGIAILGDSLIYLDDITLEITIPKAWDPDPWDGEKDVLLDKTLSWNTGVDPNSGLLHTAITAHELYMNDGDPNSDPNLFYVATIPASGDTGQYTPGGEWLERVGTYLWRIDELEPDGLGPDFIRHTGDVWAFETVLSVPDIDTATPANVMVDLDGTAIFTVSAINPFTGDSSDLSYQWYKVAEPDPSAIGTNSPTLTINNVQPANEGEYYCTVTIGSNSSTGNSRSAGLGIKRLLGHWKLDETTGTTTADSSGNSNTGTVYGAASPAWTTGILDGALSFDGVDYDVVGSLLTDYVDCGDANLLKPVMQVTVSGWYNTDTYSYYGQIAGFAYDSGSDESGYSIITEEGGVIGFWIAAGSGQYLWTSDVPAAPTGWTHVAGTYDGTTMKLYINGAEKETSTGQSGNINYDHFNRFMIGLHEADAWWLPYQGDIDDVKVYNYALDPLAVAHEYTALSGETVCLESLPLDITGPDGEPDCRINLWDFQGMAASWLECNLIPVENCPSGGV